MDQRKTLLEGIIAFKEKLSKEVPIEKCIVFGSRIKGNMHPYSDVDILIISPIFQGKRAFERGIGFHRHWNLDCPVDFLCYTPEEFEKRKSLPTIARKAVKEGIEV